MKKSILNKPEDQIFGGFLTMFLRNMTQKRPAALLQPDDIPAAYWHRTQSGLLAPIRSYLQSKQKDSRMLKHVPSLFFLVLISCLWLLLYTQRSIFIETTKTEPALHTNDQTKSYLQTNSFILKSLCYKLCRPTDLVPFFPEGLVPFFPWCQSKCLVLKQKVYENMMSKSSRKCRYIKNVLSIH